MYIVKSSRALQCIGSRRHLDSRAERKTHSTCTLQECFCRLKIFCCSCSLSKFVGPFWTDLLSLPTCSWVCVSVVLACRKAHTHTYIHIYIYIYLFLYIFFFFYYSTEVKTVFKQNSQSTSSHFHEVWAAIKKCAFKKKTEENVYIYSLWLY